MSEPILRPLTGKERRLLEQLASAPAEWTGDLLNGALVFAVVFVATQVFGWLLSLPRAGIVRLGVLVAIVLATLTVAYMRQRHAGVRGGLPYSRDLAGGIG